MQEGFDFIGREREQSALKKLIQSERASLGVVYGRRRIGKSELIKKSFADQPLLIFEGLENRSKRVQINNFLFQLARHIDTPSLTMKADTWQQALYILYEELIMTPRHIFLDEFQWMANYRHELVSELKMVWEQYLSKIPGVTLILCGSIASFMIKKVIKSNALYGRIDLQLQVKAFNLQKTELLLKKGRREVVEAHLFTGGVPKYLNILRDQFYTLLGSKASTSLQDLHKHRDLDRLL